MLNDIELKPCPFCGGEADMDYEPCGLRSVDWIVFCNNCLAKMTSTEKEDAIKQWNRRN